MNFDYSGSGSFDSGMQATPFGDIEPGDVQKAKDGLKSSEHEDIENQPPVPKTPAEVHHTGQKKMPTKGAWNAKPGGLKGRVQPRKAQGKRFSGMGASRKSPVNPSPLSDRQISIQDSGGPPPKQEWLSPKRRSRESTELRDAKRAKLRRRAVKLSPSSFEGVKPRSLDTAKFESATSVERHDALVKLRSLDTVKLESSNPAERRDALVNTVMDEALDQLELQVDAGLRSFDTAKVKGGEKLKKAETEFVQARKKLTDIECKHGRGSSKAKAQEKVLDAKGKAFMNLCPTPQKMAIRDGVGTKAFRLTLPDKSPTRTQLDRLGDASCCEGEVSNTVAMKAGVDAAKGGEFGNGPNPTEALAIAKYATKKTTNAPIPKDKALQMADVFKDFGQAKAQRSLLNKRNRTTEAEVMKELKIEPKEDGSLRSKDKAKMNAEFERREKMYAGAGKYASFYADNVHAKMSENKEEKIGQLAEILSDMSPGDRARLGRVCGIMKKLNRVNEFQGRTQSEMVSSSGLAMMAKDIFVRQSDVIAANNAQVESLGISDPAEKGAAKRNGLNEMNAALDGAFAFMVDNWSEIDAKINGQASPARAA